MRTKKQPLNQHQKEVIELETYIKQLLLELKIKDNRITELQTKLTLIQEFMQCL